MGVESMAKTIVEKLNLHKFKEAAVVGTPEWADYLSGLEGYDTELIRDTYDLIFAFVLDFQSLKGLVDKVIEKNYLNKNGYLYLAYPKKGNKVYESHIHRDDLLPGMGADEDGYISGSTIKFSRMVGLDEVFTVVGLKEDSKGKTSTYEKPSQCVHDYIAMIPNIEKDLQDSPDLLSFYHSLTPGYQKDWARYVYSAKQDATKVKRREEMKKILAAGYKSRDLFKAGKK
jgi:Bacteriocin-protection, YdeI or OmpD-Associated